MDEEMNDTSPDTPDDESVMSELDAAMRKMHPEETVGSDPFATDALGHEPAEEDDMGRL